jgi:hypothetical protein
VTQTDEAGGLSRRGFVMAGLAGLSAGQAVALPAIGPAADRLEADFSKPEDNLRHLMRVTASLDEEDVPWWFNGIVYGMVGEGAPQPLFHFEGLEIYWLSHLDDGTFELTGGTVSFMRDLESGEMLREYKNPYTGEINQVDAAAQGGGRGRGFNYSVNGVRASWRLADIPDQPLLLEWHAARDTVWLHNRTAYPPGTPPPREQRQTMFVPLDQFNDPGVRNLPTLFSSTVIQPWFRWMNMGDLPGHTIWHAGGSKIKSIDDLPKDFRERAEADHPERLTAKPAEA